MSKEMIKRILAASEDLDTLVYLSTESFQVAMAKWIRDLAKALSSVVDTFESMSNIVASTFNERRLEQIHKDFLKNIVSYVERVDLIFDRKALQYAKIAEKLNGPKLLSKKVLEDINEADEYLRKLDKAIYRISVFSQKQMALAQKYNVHILPNYKYPFERLEVFQNLTLDIAINLLKEKAEI